MESIRPALTIGACIILLLSGCEIPTGPGELPSEGSAIFVFPRKSE